MNNILSLNKNKMLLIGIIAIVLIGVPLTILQSQQEQDIRQEASQQEEGSVSLSLECQPKRICEDIEVEDEFSVEIHLENANKLDISAFMFTVNFDDALLELSKFEPKLTKFNPPIINESSVPGVIQYAAVNADPDPKASITNKNILIATLNLKAIQDGSGSATISNSQVTSSQQKDEALEVDLKDFAFVISPMSESCTPTGKKSICEKKGLACEPNEVCTQRSEKTERSCTCFPEPPTPGGVLLDLSLSLETIKPNRKNLPAHVAKSPITIEMLPALTDGVALTKEDQVVYDEIEGKFKRIIDLGKVAPGEYDVKIKVDKYLKKLVPTIITVTEIPPEETQTIPLNVTAPLLRSVDALDFGALVDCYGSKINSDLCGLSKDTADLNFDDVVDIIDLNIVLRNFDKTDD